MSTTRSLARSALTLLGESRTATLATIAPSGRPRLVPICFVLSGDDPDGRPRLHSPLDDKPKRSDDPRDLARVRDLLARPAAAILVDRWSEDWSRLAWLRLDVVGELVEPEPPTADEHAIAIRALRARYPQYAAHRLEGRPILRFTVERAVSWGSLPDRGTPPPHGAGGSASS
jgi:PPOX class probable F420-dependent enzyme